ncbi:MAG: hypothetical protein JWO31_3394 [Phycisphaerales bacterium]|nr:hypothetical protein [Phycisphaerales bacterium]
MPVPARPPVPSRHRAPRRAPTRVLASTLGLAAAAFAGGCGAIVGGGPGSCGDGLWSPPAADLVRTVPTPAGPEVPLRIVGFDRDGAACDAGPADDLVAAVRAGGFTDVYVLCPGWSPSWYSAVGWVDSFAAGVERARTWLPPRPAPAQLPASGPATVPARAYRPLYVGVVWPGDVLVDEFPPPSPTGQQRSLRPDVDRAALTEVLETDADARQLGRIEQALRDRGHAGRVTRLRALLPRAAALTPPEQLELADCLLPLFGDQEEPTAPGPRFAAVGATTATTNPATKPAADRLPRPSRQGLLATEPARVPPLDPAALLAVWKQSVREAAAGVPRPADAAGDDASRARRRGLSVAELVRWAVRAADLRVVKDRACAVGRTGFGDLLARVRRAAGGARVHVVAHSFGAEAALAALSRPADDAPPVDSLLLLSPVVSAWALAPAPPVGPDVAPALQRFARPGRYRPAVAAGVRRSVVVTYSDRDWFAASYAPRALRRPPTDGQAAPADWAAALAAPGETADGFATLGGSGPAGQDPPVTREPLILPAAAPIGPQPYAFTAAAGGDGGKLVAIDASAGVLAHGDANDRNLGCLVANQVGAGE